MALDGMMDPHKQQQNRRTLHLMALGITLFIVVIFIITLNNTRLPWQCAPRFDKACVQDAYLRRMAYDLTNQAARTAADRIQ